MAKRTRSTRVNAPPPAVVEPALFVPAPVPRRGRFWQDFELSWATWSAFRFVFFALHSVDAFLQIGHGARYGAGDFNVQQLPGALLPEPSRVGMTVVYGALCVLFALIAQGAAVRWALPIATALYGYAYFVSQLDSYQHHYLMWLVLLLLCFVPTRSDPAPPGGRVAWVRAWSLRLVLVQLAIVYAWAALAKLDPVWLDGTALQRMVRPSTIRDVCGLLGFPTVAIGVLGVEVVLAATVWIRRLWFVALPLGVGMHGGIELIGLDIGLFSYFMLAIYLLLVPDAIVRAVVTRLTAVAAQRARIPAVVRTAIAAVVIVASVIVIVLHPLPLAAVAIALALIAGALVKHVRTVALAIAPLAVLLTVTQVANDHYRHWGGASRRLGLADERTAYQGLLAVDPASEYAHYYLGQLDRKAGDETAALAHLRAAQASEPRRARAYLAEVGLQLAAQRRPMALDAIERGLAIDPTSVELRRRRDELADAD